MSYKCKRYGVVGEMLTLTVAKIINEKSIFISRDVASEGPHIERGWIVFFYKKRTPDNEDFDDLKTPPVVDSVVKSEKESTIYEKH